MLKKKKSCDLHGFFNTILSLEEDQDCEELLQRENVPFRGTTQTRENTVNETTKGGSVMWFKGLRRRWMENIWSKRSGGWKCISCQESVCYSLLLRSIM